MSTLPRCFFSFVKAVVNMAHFNLCMFDWGYFLRTWQCTILIISSSQGKFYTKNQIIMSLFLFLLVCRAAHFQPQQRFKTSLKSLSGLSLLEFCGREIICIYQILKIPKICLVQLSYSITIGLCFPYFKAFFSLSLNISLAMCCVCLKPETLCTLLLGSLFVKLNFISQEKLSSGSLPTREKQLYTLGDGNQ